MSVASFFLPPVDTVQDAAITAHPERCLNSRFRAAGCDRCANVCPAEGAISLTHGRPALNTEACLRCGLCLHYCPSGAFSGPDNVPTKLLQAVAGLPSAPLDLVCPQHPAPHHGPAPQALQTGGCLAALSPAVLLELSAQGPKIWLDDAHCAGCPLEKTQPILKQVVAEANSWGALLEETTPVSLRSEQNETADDTPDRTSSVSFNLSFDLSFNEPLNKPLDNKTPPETRRSVYETTHLPLSRRDLLGSWRHLKQKVTAGEDQPALIKRGRSIPAAERLPHSIPPQRAKILSILAKKRLVAPTTNPFNKLPLPDEVSEEKAQAPPPVTAAQSSAFPIADVNIEPARCTACGLCARFCPTGALKFLSDGQEFGLVFELARCLGQACNICVLACPDQAVHTQPMPISPGSLTKKPLLAGNLIPCSKCRQPIARGSDLPLTCFACSSRQW